MTFERTHTASITKFSPKGLGVCTFLEKVKQKEVALPYTLPGEKVQFIEKKKKNRPSTYSLSQILKSSKARVTPSCPFFGHCGGCLMLHMTPETQAHFKINLLTEHLKKQGLSPKIYPLQTPGATQRRRFRFEGIKKNEQLYLGLRKYQSHQIINLTSCYVAQSEISNILLPLKSFLEPLLPDKAQISLHLTKAENGLDIFIESPNDFTSLKKDLALPFMETHHIARLQMGSSIFQREAPYVKFGKVSVTLPPKAFLQASKDSEKLLSSLVSEFIQSSSPQKILDLFCGLGTLSLPLAANNIITGYDVSKEAIEALSHALNKTPSLTMQAFHQDLFEDPLSPERLNIYDVCFVNPPRSGMGEKQAKALAQSQLKKICYISCNPETFSKEAKRLTSGNFCLESVHPVDQFYGSAHLEVVGYFRNKKN